MDENQTARPVMRRRRKRSQFEIFKETYLPAVIACAAVIMIIIFIVGSITRGVQRAKLENNNASQNNIGSASAEIRL